MVLLIMPLELVILAIKEFCAMIALLVMLK